MVENAVRLRALRDQVLVRRDSVPDSVGVIQVVESAKELPYSGVVLTIGPDAKSGVAEGERVAFSKYAGQPVPGEKDVIALSDRELLCVLPNEGE